MSSRWTSIALLMCAAGAVFGVPSRRALADEPSRAGYAPDPPQQSSRKQWVLQIRVNEGSLEVEQIRAFEAAKALATPRLLGRYAFELYVGNALLDRRRFNVPLLAEGPAADKARRYLARPRFDRVNIKLSVQIADQPRATRAVLVDRATGEARHFAWPPDAQGHLVPFEKSLAATKEAAQAKNEKTQKPKPAGAAAPPPAKDEPKPEPTKTGENAADEARKNKNPPPAAQKPPPSR